MIVETITALTATLGLATALVTLRGVGKVRGEVQHNGGSSMKDAVYRVEEKLDTHIKFNRRSHAEMWEAIQNVREEE